MSSRAYWLKQADTLTGVQKAMIVKSRWKQGERRLTNAEIGAKLGRPGYWVSGVALVLGSRRRRPARRRATLTEADRALFAAMWHDGVHTRDIGAKFGYGHDWASVWAEKLGLPKRQTSISNLMRKEMRRRVEAGEPRAVIARSLGVGRVTVLRYTKDLPAPPPARAPKINAGLADRLLRQGMLHREVAAYFGCSRQCVSTAVKRYRKHLEARSARKPAALIPPVRIRFQEAA